MTYTARMALVFFVALINLAVGFAAALFLGRGPWSRYARRQAVDANPSAPSTLIVQTVDQLAHELESLERCFQELLERFAESPADSESLEELLSILRTMAARVASLTADETDEHYDQAAAGLQKFLKILRSAIAELARFAPKGTEYPDPAPLLSRVHSECHNVRLAFDELMSAELPH